MTVRSARAAERPARPPRPATAPAAPPERPARSRAARTAVVLAAAVAGSLLGLVGAFLVPLRIGGTPVPVSPVLAVVGNVALGVAALRASGGRAGAAGAAAGWFAVVAAASVPGPGGDLVLPAGVTAYAFLVLGALAATLPLGLGGVVLPTAPRSGRDVGSGHAEQR